MYFRECERLVQQHPDLASVFERIDGQLGQMGPPEVIRPGDLASFLSIDPNKIRSALDLLAEEGLLSRSEMIECVSCEMAAPHADYQAALDEEDEYRCTSCDRPLTNRTMRLITAYHSGEKWPAPTTSRLTRGGARGKGFAANADDHRKVAAAVSTIGDDWMANLPNLCRELHGIGAEVPKYWREEEMMETWEEIAEAVDGPGTSSAREKVSAYVRYRIRWTRKHPPASQ